MIRLICLSWGAPLLAVLLVACSGPSAASPSPTATATVARATVSFAPTPSTKSPPGVTAVALPSFAQLSAPSGQVLWVLVAGTRLFRGTDRDHVGGSVAVGDSWYEVQLPTPIANPEIAFIGPTEGWLSVAGVAAARCQQQSVSLLHTADAGATWQALSPTGIAAAQCKEALSFSDTQHGFLSAWDPNSPPVIYRSADGGRSWSASRPLPDPPGFTTSAAGFALRAGAVRSFGSTLLVDVVGQSTSGQRRYVFGSADDGATWAHRADVPGPDTAVAFVTATRWLQIGPPGGSKETTDDGASWHAFTTDYRQAAPISPAVVFGDAQVGYATVRGAIQRTIDGGAHWTGIRTPGTF